MGSPTEPSETPATGRPFLNAPQQENSLNLSLDIQDKNAFPTKKKKESLKNKYKIQEEIENQSIILDEKDMKKMFQNNLNSIPMANSNVISNSQINNNESFAITDGFKDFIRKMLLYFLLFVITSGISLLVVLWCISYDLPNLIIYGSWICWCVLNLMIFLFLHHKNLSRERKFFEIFESLNIILIIVISCFIQSKKFFAGIF